jgi:hypothetical protein
MEELIKEVLDAKPPGISKEKSSGNVESLDRDSGKSDNFLQWNIPRGKQILNRSWSLLNLYNLVGSK